MQRIRRSLAAVIGLLILCAPQIASARTDLSYRTLMTGIYPKALDFSAYKTDVGATAPSNIFEGTLHISGTPLNKVITANPFYVSSYTVSIAKTLPTDFYFQFVQDGFSIIPVQRGPRPSSHELWEYVLEPGEVWDEPGDMGYTRAVIPFSLKQKNQDCTHNGMLMFLFKNGGSVSRTAMQITSETCYYLQLDLWGLLSTSYTPGSVSKKSEIISNYKNEVSSRMPVASISQLATDFPVGIVPSNFAIGPANGNTLYGVVALNPKTGKYTNYISDCDTRTGTYPYCQVLDLPSFSTAKSVFGSIATMRLQALYPGAKDKLITSWVPECVTPAWTGVTFDNVLNMATGNYDSTGYETDELSAKAFYGLFTPLNHADKIKYSCGAYLRMATPGTTWVYHTSDSYILGTALNNYLKSQPGRSSDDIYTDLLVKDIFQPLGLSPAAYTTRRTYDAKAQPFVGYGLTYHRNDIARIAKFLSVDQGQIMGTPMLDATMLKTALQGNPANRGLSAATNFTYAAGFWGRNVKPDLPCTNDTWVPFMSGFGGISVVMFPNGVTYYNFSDDVSIDWTNPAREVQKISNYCN